MINMKDIKEKIFGVHSPSKEWHMIEYVTLIPEDEQIYKELQNMTTDELLLRAINALDRANFYVSSFAEISLIGCAEFHRNIEIARLCSVLMAQKHNEIKGV